MARGSSSLGLRSDFVFKRLGILQAELGRIERELVRYDMNLPATNIEKAEKLLQRARDNWDPDKKW